ncbi:MAG: PEP-CTERM sorting domain-containing protein [Kiritimatiellae bacterium]|nr:PEP-CTERM sorting domain-containing protein [Kiritimatiellia bacterium]MDW8459028.1 PEP-CTERM sorting domain-containing protein [Verrucomicrobiota bacterium]
MKKCALFLLTSLALSIGTVRATHIILSDFDNVGFQWAYGSWNPLSGVETLFPTYVRIAGPATESGGAGVTLSSPVTFDPSQYEVRVSARIAPGNAASGFNVIIQTSPTDLWGYYFPATLFNSSTFTTSSIPLNSPTFTNGNPDFLNVGLNEFQVQGDFSSSDRFAFEFEDLRLVPEPGTLLLLSAGAVILGLIRRTTTG